MSQLRLISISESQHFGVYALFSTLSYGQLTALQHLHKRRGVNIPSLVSYERSNYLGYPLVHSEPAAFELLNSVHFFEAATGQRALLWVRALLGLNRDLIVMSRAEIDPLMQLAPWPTWALPLRWIASFTASIVHGLVNLLLFDLFLAIERLFIKRIMHRTSQIRVPRSILRTASTPGLSFPRRRLIKEVILNFLLMLILRFPRSLPIDGFLM
jgi:hypothetical protein